MVEDIKCRQGPWREESRDAATVMNIWEASSGRNTVRGGDGGGGEERIYDGALQRRVSLRLMQGCWRHPEKYDKSSLQQLFGCSSLLRFLFSWFVILLEFNKAHVNQQQVSGSSSFTSWGDQVEVRSTHHTIIFVPLPPCQLCFPHEPDFLPLAVKQSPQLLWLLHCCWGVGGRRVVSALKGSPASFVL